MNPQHPLSAERLYALMGDKMHDFPPYFIDMLERKLEEYDRSRSNNDREVHLRLVPEVGNDAPLVGVDCYADLKRSAKVAVPIQTLHGLASIFEILHSMHLGRHDGDPEGGVTDHLVEGLIVSGRALVKASIDAMWGET